MISSLRELIARVDIGRRFPRLRKRLDLADAYQRVFDTPQGQIVLRDLIREGGVLEVAADRDDSRFYDGKRALALHVLDRLRWSAAELQSLGQELTYEQLAGREEEQEGP